MPKLDIFSNSSEIWAIGMPALDVFSDTSDIMVKALAYRMVGWNTLPYTYLMMSLNGVLARTDVGCVAMMCQEVEDVEKQQCC